MTLLRVSPIVPSVLSRVMDTKVILDCFGLGCANTEEEVSVPFKETVVVLVAVTSDSASRSTTPSAVASNGCIKQIPLVSISLPLLGDMGSNFFFCFIGDDDFVAVVVDVLEGLLRFLEGE